MIRPAAAADADSIALIWNPWIRNSAITFTATEKRPEEVADLIRARMAAGHAFLVATDTQGQVRGFATYGQFRSGIGYARTVEHSVILSAGARGNGLGRALMTAIEAHAQAAGAHQIIGGVSAENPAGLRFHLALGYAECARIREAGYKFGRYMDLVLMQKFLS